MIKKYIRGVPGRGNEVIEILKSWGAKTNTHLCNTPEIFIIWDERVFTTANNTINEAIVLSSFEEIVLPPVFVPKEFTVTFVTVLKTNDCEGCYFQEHSNCSMLGLPICSGVIYKLKKQ